MNIETDQVFPKENHDIIDPKRIYQWQKAAQTPVAAALGAALDPATAAELRQLRALARRQAQELDRLKKAIAIFSQTPDQ